MFYCCLWPIKVFHRSQYGDNIAASTRTSNGEIENPYAGSSPFQIRTAVLFLFQRFSLTSCPRDNVVNKTGREDKSP